MRSLKTAVCLVLSLAAGLNGAELVLSAKKVKRVSLDPSDRVWKKARPAKVPLVPQTFTVPHGGGAVKSVEARSLYTDSEVFFRLRWDDPTRNITSAPGGHFPDGCAVQFPARADDVPSPFMGEKGRPVNIWHWRYAAPDAERYEKAYADYYRPGAIEETLSFYAAPARSLFAEGFGTLTPGDTQDVEAASEWKDGRWTVVFRRNRVSTEGAAFDEGAALSVAFAVWDGEDQDRDGAKSLSLWQTLVLGDAVPSEPKTPEEKGGRIFARYGCATCHGPGGTGGVKNRNAQGGEVPPIHKVRDGFTEQEVEQVIRIGRRSVPEDPQAPLPPLRMYSWGQVMDEQEVHDLVKYLWTLAPKSEEW
jgi:dimethylsulfide dehydrogenase subunit gamma/complex iron-sulfur molybdoenzyme family reductase subunit gamma